MPGPNRYVTEDILQILLLQYSHTSIERFRNEFVYHDVQNDYKEQCHV